MVELGLTESFSVKQQVLLSAAEAAAMILRVDGCKGVFLEDLREGPQNFDNYYTKFTDCIHLFGIKDQHSFRATLALMGSCIFSELISQPQRTRGSRLNNLRSTTLTHFDICNKLILKSMF
jgi:hypothetical protein